MQYNKNGAYSRRRLIEFQELRIIRDHPNSQKCKSHSDGLEEKKALYKHATLDPLLLDFLLFNLISWLLNIFTKGSRKVENRVIKLQLLMNVLYMYTYANDMKKKIMYL